MGTQRPAIAAALVLLSLTAPGLHAQAGTTIRAGQEVSGDLSTSDRVGEDGSYQDVYTLQAAAGDRLEISLVGEFDAFLNVLRETFGGVESVATNDDGGNGTDARLMFSAPETGAYQVIATSFSENETGRYTLRVASMPPAHKEPPVRILAGETRRGQLATSDPLLEDGSFYDEFTFSGEPGERMQIDLMSPEFDAYLAVGRGTRDAWSMIRSDDDGGDGLDSRLIFTLPDNGDYVLRANSLSAGNTGGYSISLTSLGMTPPPSTGDRVILSGETRVGSLDADDPVLSMDGTYYDDYTYQGRQGERIIITLRSDEFDTYLLFGEGSGEAFQSIDSDDDGAGGTDSRLEVTLPATGTFTIRANALFENSTGAYTLQVESGA